MHTAFKFLLNVATTAAFLLALLALYLAANTSDRALELHQIDDSPEEKTTTRIDACHGGLWIMHLQESPNPESATWFYTATSRTTCQITLVTTGWEERLSPKQTGPIHLGFCTNPSSFQKDVPATDPVIREPTTVTIMAQGRMSRIPLAAIITVLLSLPAVRCIRAIRRKRARPHTPQRPLVSNRRELFFKAAATTSALLLIFTLFEWRSAQTIDLEIASIRAWKSQPFSPFDDNSRLSEIEFTPAGLRLSKA